MKSSPSLFNATVFKKNLTRFAPAWGLYTVGLLLILLILMDGGSRWFASSLCDLTQGFCIYTFFYALLCSQLLFGDLYNSRMCYSLHALPLRRETWFTTNVLSGFTFCLIPTVIFAILAGIASLFYATGDWKAAVLWLLGVNLQFVCFFGMAVCSAFCAGSRFAQAVVYGILNFGSLILGWLVDTVFVPMYYGIKINIEPFFWFAPLGQMTQEPFCEQERHYNRITGQSDPGALVMGDNFIYYFIAAAVGIGLLLLALRLYRRRDLERAGDFLAIRGLEPVFLVVYTVIMGTVFHFISEDIFGMDAWVMLFLGIPVGWFTGKMLLERTPRVFRKKNCLGCGLMMIACILVLTVAGLDPFGVENWVPEAENVEFVTIADGHYNYHDGIAELEDPEEIRKIIDIHKQALQQHEERISKEAVTVETVYEEILPDKENARMDVFAQFTITYRMKNGRTVNRYYNLPVGDETGLWLNQLFSEVEVVLERRDIDVFLAENKYLRIRDYWVDVDTLVSSRKEVEGLMDAIMADCEAGHMAQNHMFHIGENSLYWINFSNGLEITVYSDCENTLNWLRAKGLDVDTLIEERTK